MTIRDEMERQFGRKTLDRVIKAGEFFDAVDAISGAFQALRIRVEALEALEAQARTDKSRPTVRVTAPSRVQP